MAGGLPDGVYDDLLTVGLSARLGEAQRQLDRLDGAEGRDVFAAHLEGVIGRALSSFSPEEQLRLVNKFLTGMKDDLRALGDDDLVAEPARMLRSVGLPVAHPQTPLRRSDLFINVRDEPSLHAELRAEMASAEKVDLLCAFIKWQGLRLLIDAVGEHCRAGRELRVITTTYVGATERRALDGLVRCGAQVKISYETRTTRLHAKAWLFRRDSGWDTGYVGSSNLSRSALVDGLEWNVRLSRGDTPALLDKFGATFDAYWADPRFETYDPETDADRLDDALRQSSGPAPISLAGVEVRPYPYQQAILDDLDLDRKVRGEHRSLVVAATGTGKTIVAALDFRRLLEERGDLSLLFVAHRREILEQSQATFAVVLADGSFGERWVAGQRPRTWRHVFASIQTITTGANLAAIDPAQFDVVIVDEFHHAHATTYRRFLNRVQPKVLLGLTATPDRADGGDVTEWFGGRITSELRLWHALEQDLLCPFHYFGISDGTDLRSIGWHGGAYDVSGLDNLYTGNDTRARIVLRNLGDIVTDTGSMRALGFCVSVDHARYMARVFNEAGIAAVAVDASTDADGRAAALRNLRDRTVNIVFAVDLFNEGVDVPQVDTVLFLRPTESATVFLQQLGRGLRRTSGKACLTALDFVGHHHQKFRWDVRLRALTGTTRADLIDQIDKGFPFLPAGSSLNLDSVARERVLENVKAEVDLRKPQLVADVASYPDFRLKRYLVDSGREPATLYRRQSWTDFRRAAKFNVPAPGPDEDRLLKRMRQFLHVDDAERLRGWRTLLAATSPPLGTENDDRAGRLQRMLWFTLWYDGGQFRTYDEGWHDLWHNPAVREEIDQVLEVAEDRVSHVPRRLAGLDDVPLWVHCRYSREELLAAVGRATLQRPPSSDREGVRYAEEEAADVFTFTLTKSERRYSPTTMYRDYAISPNLVHWESQSTTSETSKTGLRYIEHVRRGGRVLLFCRESNDGDYGSARPYFFLGSAQYVSHTGSRPMAITWKLDQPMPADFFEAASVLAG